MYFLSPRRRKVVSDYKLPLNSQILPFISAFLVLLTVCQLYSCSLVSSEMTVNVFYKTQQACMLNNMQENGNIIWQNEARSVKSSFLSRNKNFAPAGSEFSSMQRQLPVSFKLNDNRFTTWVASCLPELSNYSSPMIAWWEHFPPSPSLETGWLEK